MQNIKDIGNDKLRDIRKEVDKKDIKDHNDYDDGRFFKKIKHKIKNANLKKILARYIKRRRD